MIVCLIVPLFPSTCKTPLLAWEVGRSIAFVCAGGSDLSGCSIPRTQRWRCAEVADDTSNWLVRARLLRHLHQPRSALPSQLVPHKASRKKSLRNTWTPVLFVTVSHSFSKPEGITFQVNAHVEPNPKGGMPKSRAAAPRCPFRTIQLLKTPPPQQLQIIL